MTAAGLIELTIDEKAHNYAKIYSSLLSDEFQRKRAYASLTALYALINLLEKTNNDVQKTMTIFRNPVLNEQYEISDLYVNDWHLDVRVITEGDAFLVPKCHFDNNIVPDFYAVIKIDKKMETADLLGFADTKTMKKEGFDYHYYSVSNKNLLNYAEFLSAIASKKQINLTQEDHNLFKSSYLSLMDNEIDKYVKMKLLKHLFECSECRAEFCCFTGFEMVNCNLSKYPEILEDQTLNIIGAQAVESEKYKDKEETIYIGDEEQNPNKSKEQDTINSTSVEAPQNTDTETIGKTQITESANTKKPEDNNDILSDFTESPKTESKEEPEETVSDILDELFGDEDPAPKYQDNEEKPIISSSLINDNPTEEDLTIISDDLNNLSTDNSEDLEIIVTEEDNNKISDKETILEEYPQNIQEEHNEELVIINSSEADEDTDLITESPTIIQDEKESDIVQKVIVDYDEFGEPIYSYITNVNNMDNDSEISEIEQIDEDNTSEDNYEELNTDSEEEKISDLTEETPTEEITETTQTQKISARPVDYYFPPEDEVQNNENNIETTTAITEEEEQTEPENATPASIYLNEKTNSNDKEDELIEEYNDNKDDYENNYNDSETNNKDVEENYSEYDSDTTDEDYTEYDENKEESDSEYDDEYDEDNDDEDEYNNEKQTNSSKKNILVATFIILLLLSCGGAFFLMKNINAANNIADNNVQNQTEVTDTGNNPANDLFTQPENNDELVIADNNQDQNQTNNSETANETAQAGEQIPDSGSIDIPSSGKIEVPGLTEKDLLKQKDQTPTGDVNKVMSNAFANGNNTITIRGVNWQCAPSLFTDKEFKSYLQNLDNILKLNLRKNILDATENAPNNSVSIKMAIDNEGNLLRTLIASSSGSDEIDNIVLQSIKETLESQKTRILSDDSKKADKYYLQVVIKL